MFRRLNKTYSLAVVCFVIVAAGASTLVDILETREPWFGLLLVEGLLVGLFAMTASAAINSYNERSASAYIENQQLRDEASRATTANQRFWSNVSHELRTPLNSILGYTELLLESEWIKKDALAHSDLTKVNSAGADLLTLINNVLTVSGIEVESKDRALEMIDLHELAKSIDDLANPIAERNEIEFVVNEPGQLLEAKVDPQRLERLLLALVMNALKYTDHGVVSLSYWLDDQSVDSELVFEVEDNGPALCGNVFAREIAPFARQSGLRDDDLGLAVSEKISREMGANISATSENGINRFICRLKTEVLKKPRIEMPASGAHGHAPHVLVVDEGMNSSEILARYLKRMGCRVTISNDSAAGKDMAALLRPELVVLDLDSKSISGLAVLKHFKFDSKTRDIPLIATSVSGQRAQARALGVSAYLTKPITGAAMMRAFATVPGVSGKFPPGGTTPKLGVVYPSA